MSQAKVESRWQPPANLRLRAGQQQIINVLADQQSKARMTGKLIAELPTGYGKTLAICIAFAYLRSVGAVQRLLIVVPSAEQFNSYLEEIQGDMARIGAPISGAYQAVSDLSIRLHRKNEAEIFVTTIQAISNGNMATIHDLMSQGKWMLAADEYHRYAEANTWGNAIKELMPNFTMAVSATPRRTDKGLKAIEGQADIQISLLDAVEEGAIRRVVTHVMDYHVDLTMGGEQTPERFSLSTLKESICGNERMQDLSIMEVKKEIRYYSKYITEALLNAVQQLEELNSCQPGEHKMLIFALGVRHAQSICDQLKGVAPHLRVDWIGTMSTDKGGTQHGRSELENEDVLRKFKKGEVHVLVQVRKASEGFNDVKCSVLVFLNLLHESVLLIQAVGRGLRRNLAIPEEIDFCHVFVSHDHPGVEYLKDIAKETNRKDVKSVIDERSRSNGSDGPIVYDIPDFFIVDSHFSGVQLFFPLGSQLISQSNAIEKVRAAVPMIAGASEDVILAAIEQALGVAPVPLSTSEKVARAKERVTKAVNTLAGNVNRIRASRSGGTLSMSILGDTCRAIHSRWIKAHGGQSQSEMTADELEKKYMWVQSINKAIGSADDSFQGIQMEAPWLIL